MKVGNNVSIRSDSNGESNSYNSNSMPEDKSKSLLGSNSRKRSNLSNASKNSVGSIDESSAVMRRAVKGERKESISVLILPKIGRK